MPSPIYPRAAPATFFNAQDYGAVPDSYYTDGVATNASPTFTSATANFTQSDVGKYLTALHAGSSSLQAHSSVILSVQSATSLTLTNNCGRSQSSVRFYINRGGDQTAAIQRAIDAAQDSVAGGGVVFLPGVGYAITTLVLKDRVSLQGAGQGATTLRQLPATNFPMIRNDYTTNNNASLGFIRDLRLLGARSRQSDWTTTLNGAFGLGAATVTVTDASGMLPAGTFKVGSTWYRYQSKSGNVLTMGQNGIENTVDSAQSGGATVTAPVAHGIFLYRDPITTFGTNDDQYDLHYRISNVYFFDIKGDGFQQYGQSATMVDNCAFEYCDNVAVRPCYDSFFNNINVGNTGRFGWVIHNSQIELSNVVTYFSGGNVNADGYGYCIEGPSSIEEGTKNLVACSAQDNKAGGYLIRNAERVSLSACSASSNSTSSAGTYPALLIDGSKHFSVDLACVERQATPTQTHAIKFLETAGITNDMGRVRITHGAAFGAGAVSTVFDTSTITGAVEVSVNGMGGLVAPAFAASYTPDPYTGNIIYLGAITAGLTINAPTNSHLGCELEFKLLQGGAGAFAVSWNGAFAFAPAYADTGNATGKIFRARFRYNGTNWQLMWMSQSAVAGTYWC